MAEAALNFGDSQESGEAELAGGSPLAMNVLVDGKGAVRRRPGLASYSKVPAGVLDASGINGLHVTAGDDLFAAAASGKLFRLRNDGVAIDLSGVTPAAYLAGGRRPTWAENEVVTLVAAGGAIQKIDLAFSLYASTRLLDVFAPTEAPPPASHLVAMSSRMVANDLTVTTTPGGLSTLNQIRYSRPGRTGYADWPARYVITAEAQPDPVAAIHANSFELWVWGTETLQLLVPDASSVLAPAKTLPRGLLAPYSVVRVDEQFAWLDRHKRFVLSDGRGVQDISAPIGRTLDAITTFSDCFGYRVLQDQFDAVVWTFPTDGRSFCYQLGGGWSQWQTRNSSTSGPKLFPVMAHVARDADAIDLVGLTTGQVCQLTTSATDDLGEVIDADVMTGFDNRGTDARKWCQAVRLSLKRGFTASTSAEPIALLAWRDTLGDWESPIPLGMGVAGDREVVVELRSLGTYRRRQWRLTFTGADDWVLASATEEYTVENE